MYREKINIMEIRAQCIHIKYIDLCIIFNAIILTK